MMPCTVPVKSKLHVPVASHFSRDETVVSRDETLFSRNEKAENLWNIHKRFSRCEKLIKLSKNIPWSLQEMNNTEGHSKLHTLHT